MANSFGDITSSRMIHDIVDDLVARLGPLLRLATNFSEETANGVRLRTAAPGSTIKIEDWNLKGAGVPAVYNVNPAVGYVAGDVTRKPQRSFDLPSTITAMSIAITPAEYRILISDNVGIDGYATFRQRLQEAVVDKFATHMVDRFLSKLTALAFPNATPLSVFNRTFELGIEKKLFDRKLAGKDGATMIVSSQGWLDYTLDHVAIQTNTGDAAAVRAALFDQRASTTTSFQIARTHATLPTPVAQGFAYTRTAAYFAARIPDEPTFEGDPVGLQEIVHEPSGMPMLSRVWKDPKTGILQLDFANIYEFYANQPEAIERFTTPA